MENSLSVRQEVLKFALERYGTRPEHLWKSYPDYAVLRHSSNNKWYAAIMNVQRNKLGLHGNCFTDILNVKCDPIMIGSLRMQDGILPAYHMNKANWITVLLDGTVDIETIFSLIELSFDLTDTRKKQKSVSRHIVKWIIPANPKYYDIEAAVSENEDGFFLWKQSNNIFAGDTVYIYVAAPISSILYKCEVLETDIPYQYSDGNINMNRAMRLKLLERYDKKIIGLDLLKKHGVYAVRGPRGIPESLVNEINRIYHT